VVIDEEFVKKYFPNEEPIARTKAWPPSGASWRRYAQHESIRW
jgi:hypothetical protein